ncbi:MAG TPA: mechanosensitive ion channel family protein [Actinomycetota bacterium]|nr:mechanosensitive ion channel family protein [Actinomycetota bacterium]
MSWDRFVEWLGENQEAVIAGALRLVVVLVAAYVLTRVLRRLVQRVQNKVAEHTTPIRTLQRTETLTRVLSSAGIVVIWTIALFMALQTLGFNLAPLLAGVGIVGLAVGFGAQNLVRDVVTGFFILLEDQYGVGDIVEVNQIASGKVEQLTLRVTGLRGLDGTMHYLPNGSITHVANRSKDWARAVVDVGVGYGEDPDVVRRVLESVMAEAKESSDLARKLYSTPEVLGVEMLGEYEVVWRITAEVKPGRQWEVARALRERIKVAFDENKIEIPFPHRVMISADTRGDGARRQGRPSE